MEGGYKQPEVGGTLSWRGTSSVPYLNTYPINNPTRFQVPTLTVYTSLLSTVSCTSSLGSLKPATRVYSLQRHF